MLNLTSLRPWAVQHSASRRCAQFSAFVLLALPIGAVGAETATSSSAGPPDTASAEVSRDASRVYARAKPSLIQVRVLTASGRSQASVGSGFVIGGDGLAITNYHVVSRLVLDPSRYVAQAVSTSGEKDDLAVLKVDVLNDLALIRLKERRNWPALRIRSRELVQGERLYSLGNPLDLGFAISEGSFNGEVTRPHCPQMLFSGAINPGMSGGPAVEDAGGVVGVNVSKRLDGEQISFLVPARFVADLLARGAAIREQPTGQKFRADIARQLTAHQATMTAKLLASPLATRALGPYSAPVTEAPGIRCWGSDPDKPELKYQVSFLACRMESALFVQDTLRTGFVNVRHEFIATDQLDAFRFLRVYSQAYRNETFGAVRDRHWTGPECTDAFVKGEGANRVPVRAVVCVRAMRKFEGLYDFALMAATVDDGRRGLQTRVDASGVSIDNGQRIVKAFLDAIGRQP